MIVRFGTVCLSLFALIQTIPICRPLKEEEFYTLKLNRTILIGSKKIVDDELYQHKCMEVDDHGVEHMEAKCLEGTTKVGDEEPESTKGETYNYFQNSKGQRFEYEEIRLTLKDDPLEYVMAEMHSKLKDASVVAGETWRDKSTNTSYSISVGEPKLFMKTECIQVIRKGIFTNGISGEFKEESWYRVADGQVMSQQTTADKIVIPNAFEIQFFEKSEFRPEKS